MTCCVWPGLCYKLCTFSSWKVRGSRLEQILDFSVPFRPWSLWYTISLTKSLQSISHSLVFHHVNESPAQAEVGEDEEDRLQDVIDVLQLLLRKKKIKCQWARWAECNHHLPGVTDDVTDPSFPSPTLQPHKNSRIRNVLPGARAPLDSQCCCVAQDAINTSELQ